jgi:hypothetical protein
MTSGGFDLFIPWTGEKKLIARFVVKRRHEKKAETQREASRKDRS